MHQNRKTGIRRKLVAFFLTLLSILFSVVITLGILHFTLIGRYEQIGTNIFNQNELINATSRLVLSYNVYRNAPIGSNLEAYDSNKKAIADIFSLLSVSITSDDSRRSFSGVRNTISKVIEDTDEGIASLQKGDIVGTSAHYDSANRKLDFVRENVADLLLKEINHSAELQDATARIDRITSVAGGLLFLIIFAIAIAVALAWSRQIVDPLLRLDAVTKRISGGDIDADVDRELLEDKDEIGSLARSFDVMIHHLRDNLNILQQSKDEIERSRDSAEGLVMDLEVEKDKVQSKVNELERMNKLMINRELKMIELKKEIADLKSKQAPPV
jgi:nitrogen fixation/metabolism regulation signal transduction histidine kinase